MNDQASPPDGEKPRFLLPEGCGDLIDVLRGGKAEGHGSVSYLSTQKMVPNGLDALREYVARLFQNPQGGGSLAITAPRWLRLVFLLRMRGKVLLSYCFGAALPLGCEAAVRAFAAKHSLSTVHDQHIDNPGGGSLIPSGGSLLYQLPAKAETVIKLCRELLEQHLGVQPYEKLTFIFHVSE